MNRSTFRSFLIAAASAAVAILPMTSAGAQSLSTPLLSPEQVRADFVDQGFQTSQPITWWTNGSTSFTVEDPAEQNMSSARVLMVIVYPDLESAHAAAQRDGGHLVPGYGPSTWQDNVALQETTRAELARRYAAEVNRNDPSFAGPEPELMADPGYVVGLDFVAVVQPVTGANL
jgi:hypothetical protein